ncbi:deoxynucleoside triphosphate triphosphohydrolase SAMHD1-like [Tigriopus californicus]|uniref:deoxynucleoside triphosphate triphosphohydrolase SAMHD1-like n=1 Tax=Tigriopus californicus TaxID=6832 RepID=UPI0027DA6AFD|nr:deoxynucleoside triphosphate triphosphohydrolase SAMHD1-like [Tigriopus californicus]XP_059091616.1 deoxynucleoside triphosphate triphosphohydrolase SAMHD1-like [Tigriopus californicus]
MSWEDQGEPRNGGRAMGSPPGKKARPADFDLILKCSKSTDFFNCQSSLSSSPSSETTSNPGMHPEDMDGQVSGAGRRPIFTNEKVINDCIHGSIQLPPAILAIVDTPQFQRLRYIKQTGTCHLVFPNATHNRFQHSIGVGHLARKFAEELRRRHQDWMDEKDILCVMMAGVCHDLGHGPFSHLWEQFVKEAGQKEFHHEDLSIAMFNHLIEENNLRPKLKELGDLNEDDLLFVKEQIAGPICKETGLPDHRASHESWPYRGRDESKSFLYEIVANKETGIDVDKWDYFLRDDYYLKIGHLFDHQRFISYSKVLKVDPGNGTSRRRICLRDKEAQNLLEMCCDRARLHSFGYQHRVSKVADRMLKDAWLSAKDHIQVKGKDGQVHNLVTASTAMDMVAHCRLTDEYVYFKIMEDANPKLKDAQAILNRIERRDFYLDVFELNTKDFPVLHNKTEKEVKQMLLEYTTKFGSGDDAGETKSLDLDQIVVLKKVVSTGTKTKKAFFYRKDMKIISTDINTQRVNDWEQESFFICCKDRSLGDITTKFAMAWSTSLRQKNGHIPE